jgi:hypothetical protein
MASARNRCVTPWRMMEFVSRTNVLDHGRCCSVRPFNRCVCLIDSRVATAATEARLSGNIAN